MSGVEGFRVGRIPSSDPRVYADAYVASVEAARLIDACEPGRWFSEPVAAALVDAVSAITYADSSGYVDRKEAWRGVHAALDALDAARAQEPS